MELLINTTIWKKRIVNNKIQAKRLDYNKIQSITNKGTVMRICKTQKMKMWGFVSKHNKEFARKQQIPTHDNNKM